LSVIIKRGGGLRALTVAFVTKPVLVLIEVFVVARVFVVLVFVRDACVDRLVVFGFVIVVDLDFVVDFVKVLVVSEMNTKTLEMIIVFIESTMMISASETTREASGAHEKEPLLLT
jgi:hypothetical protein